MTQVQSYPPGSFCWIELATTDAPDAKRFYSALFGWDFQDIPIAPGLVYTTSRIGSGSIGALHQIIQPEADRGESPHWLSYISVASLPDTIARAVSFGATVVRGPMDVFDLGKTAVIQDPEGARFALWQPGRHIGADAVREPGAMAWNELAAHDSAKASAFYASLFGWTPRISAEEELGLYTEMLNGVVPACGILPMPEEWAVPPFWLGYFAVGDCDVVADKAVALGGSVEYGPRDIPGVGRHAVIADPQLAVFAIIQFTQ
jgi:predicted enzyme related to lactoylglutathione lyase